VGYIPIVLLYSEYVKFDKVIHLMADSSGCMFLCDHRNELKRIAAEAGRATGKVM
jgi:hypothetical protein